MTQRSGDGDPRDPGDMWGAKDERDPKDATRSGRAGIEDLFTQVDLLPFGPEGRALLDEALRRSREAGEQELEYRARLRLISAAEMMGDTDAVLSNFAWCVARNDEDPARFPTEVDDQDLLWFYKWIPATLAAHPTFSRAEVIAALDNMERRYGRDGVGRHGVIQARFSEALRSGHLDEAESLRLELLLTDRDDYSHCEACARAELVDYALERGQPEDALRAFDEIMEQGLTCGEEPEAVMATMLLPLLRAERFEDAVRAHRMGYRLAKDNPALMPSIALHIEFCALTGNHARALSLLERHITWLGHDELDVNAHFSTLLCVAVACESIAAAGHGDLDVRGSAERSLAGVLGAHEGPYTVAELGAAAWAAAEPIAVAFDARNGTDRYARRQREARGHLLESYELPLSEQQIERHERASEPADDDVDGWIDAATWAAVADDMEHVSPLLRRALAGDPTPRQRLVLWGLMASCTQGEERDAAVAERVQAFEDLGLGDEAAFEREHGALISGTIGEEGAELLTELLPTLTSDELIGRVHTELGLHHLSTGDTSEAMGHFLQGAEAADRAGDEDTFRRSVIGACWAVPLEEEDGALQSRLLDMAEAAGPRANQAYDVGYLRSVEAVAVHEDRELAARLSRDAADLAASHRAVGPLSQITRFRAELLNALGRHAEAAAAQRLLNQTLRELGMPLDLQMLVGEGRSLVRAGEMQDALEVLSDAGRGLEEDDETTPGQWALQDRWYGEAAEGCEFYGTAFDAWVRALEHGEEALEEAPELRDAQLAGLEGCMSARNLVHLASEADEDDDVREYGVRAVSLARALVETEHGLLPVTLQQVGRALAKIGEAEGLTLLEEAEGIARQEGAEWFAADVLDARGRALLDFDRADEGLPLLLRAADEYAAQGDGENAAMGEYTAARVLAHQGRTDEALVVFGTALERVRETPGQIRSGIAGAYGDLLEAQERHAEAEEVRGLIG